MSMYVTESFSGTDAPDPHAPASNGMDGRTATKKPTTLKGLSLIHIDPADE